MGGSRNFWGEGDGGVAMCFGGVDVSECELWSSLPCSSHALPPTKSPSLDPGSIAFSFFSLVFFGQEPGHIRRPFLLLVQPLNNRRRDVLENHVMIRIPTSFL